MIYLRRTALNSLKEWRFSEHRLPLILRGARQVGKSWLVREFANDFDEFVEINFEKEPKSKSLFSGSLAIESLLEKLRIFTGKTIVPKRSLLFFDEIQECPEAITALRYFKEDYPELHVISAGSLIDFVLEEIGMPVGRVQFLYCYPLSFYEFLLAQGREDLYQYILGQDIDPVIHEQALDYVKTYFWLGGMPAVVKNWLENKNTEQCRARQDEIITSYMQDLSKYTSKTELQNAELIFNAVPKQLGNKFKYVNVDPDIRSSELKKAIYVLRKAGIIYQVNHSSGQGFPLAATQKSSHFKCFFFDIGLAQRILGLELNKWLLEKLNVQHIGAVAEQFVAQEYIAYTAQHSAPSLFYWHRQARTSNAEVDFLFVKQQNIIPAEVKAGSTGHLKSLLLFLEQHTNSSYGLRISEQNFSEDAERRITSIPLYAIKAWLEKT